MTLPAHARGCARLVAWVDPQARPRRRFFHGGGWTCPRCTHDRATTIAAQLDDLTTLTPTLYFGELTLPARDAALRQARRLANATLTEPGRIMATRDAATCLLLADANLTPRTGILNPFPRALAIAHFTDSLEQGPRVRRVTSSTPWRITPDTTSTLGGVRVGTSTPDLIDDAIRAAGYQPDIPSTDAPPEVAANIAFHLEQLKSDRTDRDHDVTVANRWHLGPRSKPQLDHSWRTDRDPARAEDYGEQSWVS